MLTCLGAVLAELALAGDLQVIYGIQALPSEAILLVEDTVAVGQGDNLGT